MTGRTKSLIAAALIAGVAASILNFVQVESFDVGEESGGRLTGPMIMLSFWGSALLLAGATAQIWRRRVGGGISLAGLALMLPLFSWFFAAGWWCSSGKCKVGYSWLFRFGASSALIIVLACISITLQWWPRRP